MRLRTLAAGLLALALPVALPAMQYIDLRLISPVTGQEFPAKGLPGNPSDSLTMADMGSDDDGCRHSSNSSEYDYYVAVDPTSYFAALVAEWDSKTGRFNQPLPADIREWVLREYNGELMIDVNRAFQLRSEVAKNRGLAPVDRAGFRLDQEDISLEKKFRLAVQCYDKRKASASTIAPVALLGAWAIRARLNVPVSAQFLAGGFEEVNEQVNTHIKDGERFSVAKWLPIYKEIFESNLTSEGALVAGCAYFGLALRDGDMSVCQDILKKLSERFQDEDETANQKRAVMRGLVRERKRMFMEYLKNEELASRLFMQAVAEETYIRVRLPEIMFGVAECLRRTSRTESQSSVGLGRAMDWYLAVAKLPETQPALRESIRAQNRAPSEDAPITVQLGWKADLAIKRLTDGGLVHPGTVSGQDRVLLSAIVNDGLGTAAYVNPIWKPTSGGNQQDLAMILDTTGKALLDHAFRRDDSWPDILGELWERGFIRDRNHLNRFHCPVTGRSLLYEKPKEGLSKISPRQILVASPDAVSTNQGPRYGAFLANNTMVWSVYPLKPGTIFGQ